MIRATLILCTLAPAQIDATQVGLSIEHLESLVDFDRQAGGDAALIERLEEQVRELQAAVEKGLVRRGGPDESQILQWQVRIAAGSLRLGNVQAARHLLVELADASEPFATWAKARVLEIAARTGEEVPPRFLGFRLVPREGASPQDPQGKRLSYLEQCVALLDSQSGEELSEAWAVLASLGAAAVPTILERLPNFSPVGIERSLEHLLPYIDGDVVATFRQMIQSEDVAVQAVISRALVELRGEARVELGRLALQCQSEEARVAGVEALLKAGVDRDRCMEVLVSLHDSSSSEIQVRLIEILGHPAIASDQRIDSWLEQWIREGADASRDDKARAALKLWLDRRQPEERARRAAMFRTLGTDLATRMLRQEAGRPPRSRDYDLLFEALRNPSTVSVAVDVLPHDEVVRDVGRLVGLLNEVEDDALLFVLGLLTSRPTPGTEDNLVALLDNPDRYTRELAAGALAAVQPVAILDNYQRFLVEAEGLLRDVARGHARPQDIAWIIAAGLSYDLRSVIQGRSDGTNLRVILDAVSVPPRGVSMRTNEANESLPKWFGAQHVAPALSRLYSVKRSVARTLLSLCANNAGPEHIPDVIDAIRRSWGENQGEIGGHEVRNSLIPLLGHLGGAGVEYLESLVEDRGAGGLAVIALKEADETLRRRVYHKVFSDPALRYLHESLLDDDLLLRDSDLQTLVAASPELWASAGDHSERPYQLLRSMPVEVARPAALEVLANHEKMGEIDYVALNAIAYLGSLRDEELLDSLGELMATTDLYVRSAVVDALGHTMSPKAAPFLIEALGDEVEGVRESAEKWLLTIATALEKKKQFTERFEKIKK